NDVQMIYADCFIENKATIRILEKLGMQPFWNNFIFNTLRAWSYNEDREAVRHTITKEQWARDNG
nr:GNAT family protein [Pyrinomonadaceae bacterium]